MENSELVTEQAPSELNHVNADSGAPLAGERQAQKKGEADHDSTQCDLGAAAQSDIYSVSGSDVSSNRDSGGSWKSSEYPALELNYDALKHIARYYLPGNHGRCIDIDIIGRGTYHEVRALYFEDDWSCIGRFTRNQQENVAVAESEIATRECVLKHTTIRVPQTYFVNLDPTNAVGAPFVLMEHLEGHHLYKMWGALKTEYRLCVLADLSDVLAQLTRLRFEKIGSLRLDSAVGPLQNLTIPEHESGRGPWNTTKDYMLSFLPDTARRQAEIMQLHAEVRVELESFMQTQTSNTTLRAPYRLIHGDFDAQNCLFIWESPSQPPRLSGIIDWDYSYTGPLYHLLEYPVFIQDTDLEGHLYNENKVLRKEFVRMIAQKFPKGSDERRLVRECFAQKTYALNGFSNLFTSHLWSRLDLELMLVKDYIEQLRGTAEEMLPAYNGRHDYEPDSELESDDGEQVS